MRSRNDGAAASVESLESRMLFASNSLSALFGGSVLFARKDGGVNRIHATLHVDAQNTSGGVSGRLQLDGLGKFSFDGALSNDVLTAVFDSAAGTGSLIVSQNSSGDLSGEMLGTIGGVVTAGSVRFHDNGGSVTNPNVAGLSGATVGNSFSSEAVNSPVAGTYGGTISFQGDAPVDELTVNSTPRKRFHAVLHLGSADTTGHLLGGNFRIDHVGKYHVTGSNQLGRTTLVFSGSNGSGSLVLNSVGSSALNVFTPTGSKGGSALDLAGKLFGMINGIDVHGKVTLHNTLTGELNNNLGETNPSTIQSGSNQFSSISSSAAPTTPSSTDLTTPNPMNPFLPNGSSSMNDSGDLVNSVFG